MKGSPCYATRWQQLCLGFLCLLSLIIRMLPRQAAISAGPYAWISALLSIIPLALIFLLSDRAFKNAGPEEGFAQLFIRALGPGAGKGAILLFTVWLVFYLALVLHNASDRYISSTYQGAPPLFFILILLTMAMVAALNSFRALARTAEVFFPLLILAVALVLFIGLREMDPQNLPPISSSQVPEMLSGIPIITVVQSVSVYFGFLEGRVGQKEKRRGAGFLFILLLVTTVTLICAAVIGFLGTELTRKLSFPFFVMVRNLSLFNVAERIDAVVVGLWVVSDFMITSSLLFIIINNLRICFGLDPVSHESEKRLSFRNGRWITWLCGAVTLALSAVIFPSSFDLAAFFNRIVPLINAGFIFVLLPAILFIGLAKKKL